jgi:hypothetical protein
LRACPQGEMSILMKILLNFGTPHYGSTRHHFIFTKSKIPLSRNAKVYSLIGIEPARVTKVTMDFLMGKGVCVLDEQFTYIRLFGFEGKPLLLPHFVCDIFFVYELCR